jgi:hypothetical protein
MDKIFPFDVIEIHLPLQKKQKFGASDAFRYAQERRFLRRLQCGRDAPKQQSRFYRRPEVAFASRLERDRRKARLG